MEKIILTVCKGNIHRSVIAAACINRVLIRRGMSKTFRVISRGLQGSFGTAPPRRPSILDYPEEWALTAPALHERNIEIPMNQTATPVSLSDVEGASVILAMDKYVLDEKPESLMNQFPDHRLRMFLFMELAGLSVDVPDCAGKRDLSAFSSVTEMIYSTVENNFDVLLKRIG